MVAVLEGLLSVQPTEADSLIADLPSNLHDDAVDVLANVAHFVSDFDIRVRDDGYREMQEAHMRRLIQALRSGAPREQLLKFNFLTPDLP